MMKRYPLPVFALVLALLSGCAGIRMQRADQAYGLLQFPKAARNYERVLDHKEDRAARARSADAYRRNNIMDKAYTNYAVLESTHALRGDTAMAFGEVLMALGQHERAGEMFLRVLEETPENKRAMDLYGSTQGYSSFYADSGRFFVNRLTLPGIATAFAATPYGKGILVAGEKDMRDANGNPWNERPFLDLYYSEKRSIVMWNEAEPLPGLVNGAYHEGPATLSADGKALYFTRSNYLKHKLVKDDRNTSHLKLFRAIRDEDGHWGDLHEFAYNSDVWSTGHAALSADGHTLFFASDRPGGFGGTDIWRCRNNGSGWSEPENLGSTVNSAGNELFPTINGNALHFSSTAHSNMGGLDIFEVHEQNGIWTEPKNLNAPINTPHDDFYFVLDSTGKAGFLSSNREGFDQVFTFTMNEPEFYLEGIVMDESERFLPNSKVVLHDLTSGEDHSRLTDEAGKFAFKLGANSDFNIRGAHQDKLATSVAISTKGLMRSDTLSVELSLKTITIGEAITINNIYYDYDEWAIRPDAVIELDKLARLFLDNPTTSFELGSHTDARGGDLYNLVLSDARANSAVNYLIQRGVDPARITAKGYGESVLVNTCSNGVHCSEEDHQANRRTEFKVTGVEGMADVRSKP